MNLSELLNWLRAEGAPIETLHDLESKIEKRRMRIERHEQDIQRWIEERQRQADEKAKQPDLLLILLLLLILESDRDDDQFSFHDLMRIAPPPARPLSDPTGFLSENVDPKELEELDAGRRSIAAPRW